MSLTKVRTQDGHWPLEVKVWAIPMYQLQIPVFCSDRPQEATGDGSSTCNRPRRH